MAMLADRAPPNFGLDQTEAELRIGELALSARPDHSTENELICLFTNAGHNSGVAAEPGHCG